MEPSSTEIFWQSAWTVFAFVFFVGVVFWAWSGKRKTSFDEAARMALDDDKDVSAEQRRNA
ncbi:Cytochrome c oxidase (cbb3-type) subunit CcoQ [hydrothermal vent metagenome]|uniref:Cytochrome c oxidase (Cbb3-type) subunit CcoQ n=1 Tax=hydrothermal vent metagenome TaxID=652676 RepID=A0A3B0X066_9ZZZZ